MAPIIGIDLGTTNSVVSVMEGGEAKVITNTEGARTTPSVVAWTEAGEVLTGQVARRQAITNPQNTVFSVKRFMGTSFKESQTELDRIPYEVCEADNGDTAIRIKGRRYSPPEISAKILQKLRREAENYLGEPVHAAVITVPAYFNDAQRQATKDAGKIAGLDVRRLVNEPTAAALAYNLDGDGSDRTIAVYDFGGGTFDVSILDIGDGVVEVRSTAGDTHLGGDNVDDLIIDFLLDAFQKETNLDVSNDTMVLQRLKEAAEKAKIELSSTVETEVNLPFLTADASGPKHLNVKLSRARLEGLIGGLVKNTLKCCGRALEDAKLKPSDVDDVILVGGSTRIPLVQSEVEAFFQKVPRAKLNPDEVVAMGAALQGGIISGDVKDLLLLDVTPLSLGVETRGGLMTTLIERNTTIPVKRSKVFTTAVDNQRQVEIHVLQGERQFVKDNHSLGRFILDEIPPAPRAQTKIEVTFDIDANGIVNVSALEKGTGRVQQITVESGGGIPEGDIERMVAEAKDAEGADKERREVVELRNRLDGLVHSSQRKLFENQDSPDFPEDAASQVREALSEGRKGLENEDLGAEGIRELLDLVGKAIAAFGDQLAQATAQREAEEKKAKEAEKAEEEGQKEEGQEEEVMDAEVEEEK